jgi:signal transduction histidine kinase
MNAMSSSPPQDPIFGDGGSLGALCRQKDWSKTPLGPVERWPQSLKTAVSMVLGSKFPSIVLWGKELIQLYNDGYRLIMGAKHPGGLGQGNRECWPEAWHINEHIYPRVFAGETVSFEEARYPLAPNGMLEDYYLTLSYSPVRGESGEVAGVLVQLFDVTQEVRTRAERDRAVSSLRKERQRLYEVIMQTPAAIAVLEGPEHRFISANARYIQLVGNRPVLGLTVAQALPEVREQGFLDLLDGVFRSAKPFIAREARVELAQPDGSEVEVFLDFIYQPLQEADGTVFGILVHAVDVTSSVQARRDIEKLAAERKAMLAHIADAIITFDPSGSITFLNEAARTLYPKLESGKPLSAQPEAVRLVRLDGSSFELDALPSARALRRERVLNEEWFVLHPDGRQLQVQGSALPVQDDRGELLGAVLTIRDVTDQRQLEKRTEFERNRLRDIFAQAPAAIMMTRGKEHVIEVSNARYSELVGNRPLLGTPVRKAFPDLEGQGLFELYDRVLASGEPFIGTEIPVRVQRFGRTDDAFFNFAYQPLLGEDGKAYGTMTHAVEVTELVSARRLAEERANELARIGRELEVSNRELDQFAYVASHDLKAPLRGIANLSQWLEEDLGTEVSESAREHLNLLRGRVLRMEGLIEGILTYARAGRVREKESAIDTGTLVKDVLELLAPPESVTLDVQPELPTVQGEKTKLEQVFMNLIGNALKFAAASRPDPCIEVGCRAIESGFEFSIRDNGPGIEPRFHERIWGVFQTLQSRDKVEGTGIGLSVVKKIVETRGGSVSIRSEPGEGATFLFTWPAAAHEPA